MTRALSFSFLAVAVSVCLGGTEVLVISGNATASENRKDVAHVTLVRNQLGAISRWLERRQSAWSAHIADPSTEPVAISIELRRADGKIDHIDVVTAARGGHYMRLSIGPGIEWAYRSFGGIVKTRYTQQPINNADLAKLDQLLFHPASP